MKSRPENASPDPARYFFEIYGHADLREEWNGWRLRGKFLISPHGDRITPARLAGILFSEAGRLRVQKRTRADPPQAAVTSLATIFDARVQMLRQSPDGRP